MALFRRAQTSGRGGNGIAPFWAGIIAAVIIVIAVFWAFTRYNPFASQFELNAVFRSANNLQPDSPVRIAGVNVGKVESVDPIAKDGAAKVKMQITKKGLPIFKDAEMKIRPRIFLEGNFFVDVQPGTPDTPKLKSGDTVPVNQTATPVQFGQLLTALQSDTRHDLQVLLKEYAQKGLGNGGAEAYNNSLNYAPGAFRTSSIANQATLGTEPHDLSKLERGQQRLFHSLDANPVALRDLINKLNVTFAAFAREDTALQAAVPALRDTLRVGTPALVSLNNALPALRAFARDALPGTKSSGPTLDASLPFITQLRLLIRPQELRGLVHDLRPTIPALAKVNHGSVGLFNEQRALSACQNNVLTPFARTPIPDPDFPNTAERQGSSDVPWYKDTPRGLVGLAGESREADANSPVVHVQLQSGPTTIIETHGDQTFYSQAFSPPEGDRPIKPNNRPADRPDIPCETQQPPNMNAPGGPADRSVTEGGPTGLLPPLPIPFNQKIAKLGKVQLNEVMDSIQRSKKGLPTVDPMSIPHSTFVRRSRKLGLDVTPTGHLVPRGRSGR